MADHSERGDDLYTRERIGNIIGRLRGLGGMPQKTEYTYRLTTWFRTLSMRGLVSAEFLSNPENVISTFNENFPKCTTRSQYAMTFLKYLTALTDKEYKEEYPNIERAEVVALLKGIISEASKERKITEQTPRLRGSGQN